MVQCCRVFWPLVTVKCSHYSPATIGNVDHEHIDTVDTLDTGTAKELEASVIEYTGLDTGPPVTPTIWSSWRWEHSRPASYTGIIVSYRGPPTQSIKAGWQHQAYQGDHSLQGWWPLDGWLSHLTSAVVVTVSASSSVLSALLLHTGTGLGQQHWSHLWWSSYQLGRS